MTYRLIQSKGKLRSLMESNVGETLSIDLETTSLRPSEAEIVGVALSFNDDAYYIPVAHELGGNVPLADVLSVLKKPLEDMLWPKVGQNIKYDATVLRFNGISMLGIRGDSMIAQYLLDPVEPKSLDAMAKKYLSLTTIKYKDVVPKGKSFTDVPIDVACEYAAEDALVALKLNTLLRDKIDEERLNNLYKLEIDVLNVLIDVESIGVALDIPYLKSLSEKFTNKMVELKDRMLDVAGRDVNINSGKQLQELMYDEWGLPRGRRTKTGWAVDATELKRLSSEHEFPSLLLEYRIVTKMLSTYIDALPALVSTKTGRLHGNFNQAITRTGRLSSSKPNLQNIPARGDMGDILRKAFIAGTGNVLVGADYSQVELRLFAHFSGDRDLVKTYKEGGDVHCLTASKIFDTPSPSKEQRDKAKTVNFGILYGMYGKRLAKEINVTVGEAEEFLEAYYAAFPGVSKFIDRTVKSARKKGYAETYLGHRRYLPSITSPDRFSRTQACLLYTSPSPRD